MKYLKNTENTEKVTSLPSIDTKSSFDSTNNFDDWKESYYEIVEEKNKKYSDGLALLPESDIVKLGYYNKNDIPCRVKGLKKTDPTYKYLKSICPCSKCLTSPIKTPKTTKYIRFTNIDSDSDRPYTAPTVIKPLDEDTYDVEPCIVINSPFTGFPLCKGLPIHEKYETSPSISCKPYDKKHKLTKITKKIIPYSSIENPTSTTIWKGKSRGRAKSKNIEAIDWMFEREKAKRMNISNSQVIQSINSVPSIQYDESHDPNNFTVLAMDSYDVEQYI